MRSSAETRRVHYPNRCGHLDSWGFHLRIVLSNIGTLGDINPLIALALELKRRGHSPVMALPNVYRTRLEPLGLEFHAIRPDIDPTNNVLVEMIYDIKHGTENGLRNFLFRRCGRRMTICWMRRRSRCAPICCCWAN